MKKLRLDLDELSVQSFETGGEGGLGTIQGNDDDSTEATVCAYDTCECAGQSGYDYCAESGTVYCKKTVAGTCHGSTCDNARTCWVNCTNQSPCTGTGCGTENTYCDQHTCVTGCFC